MSYRSRSCPQWATDLATKIDQTWRGGPTAQVWEEELAELDEGRAGAAYIRLRRTSKTAPSVAVFLELYYTVRTSDDDEAGPVHCNDCDGGGWVEVLPLLLPTPAGSHIDPHSGERFAEVGQWRPCRSCSKGRGMDRVYAAILATNNRDRRKPAA